MAEAGAEPEVRTVDARSVKTPPEPEPAATAETTAPAARSMQDAPRGERGNTWTRDHLANERTLLAWLRTALAFMAFGLATAKLGMLLGLYAAEYPHLAASLPSPPVSRFVGAALIAAGAVLAVLGARRTRHWSAEVAGSPPRSGALDIALGITLVTGIALLLYVLL